MKKINLLLLSAVCNLLLLNSLHAMEKEVAIDDTEETMTADEVLATKLEQHKNLLEDPTIPVEFKEQLIAKISDAPYTTGTMLNPLNILFTLWQLITNVPNPVEKVSSAITRAAAIELRNTLINPVQAAMAAHPARGNNQQLY